MFKKNLSTITTKRLSKLEKDSN